MAIKAVLFDYGGVLSIEGGKGSISLLLSQFYKESIGWEKIEPIHRQFRLGLISAEDFFSSLNKIHSSPKKLNLNIWQKLSENLSIKSDEVYSLAQRLRLKSIKTGILSNTYQISADNLKSQGNYDNFEPIILSFKVHLAKPDPRIYNLAIRTLELKAEEILFVDDQLKNIPVAQALGIKTILAKTPKQIVNDVTALIYNENGTIL